MKSNIEKEYLCWKEWTKDFPTIVAYIDIEGTVKAYRERFHKHEYRIMDDCISLKLSEFQK